MSRFCFPEDLLLSGRYATLEPLQLSHIDELNQAAADGELYKLTVTHVPTPETMPDYVKRALTERAGQRHYPFVVRRQSDNKIVGCTRYYDFQTAHRNLALGFTWYSQSVQRTGINTDCKLQLLGYAFEQLGAVSLAFHTHHENLISQAAIERLGAKKDGVLRKHQITHTGQIRDTVYYSITDDEWPQVKSDLLQRLR